MGALMISVMPPLTKRNERSHSRVPMHSAVTMNAASSPLHIGPSSRGAPFATNDRSSIARAPGPPARSVRTQHQKKMQEGVRRNRKTLLHELVTPGRIETAAVVYC